MFSKATHGQWDLPGMENRQQVTSTLHCVTICLHYLIGIHAFTQRATGQVGLA